MLRIRRVATYDQYDVAPALRGIVLCSQHSPNIAVWDGGGGRFTEVFEKLVAVKSLLEADGFEAVEVNNIQIPIGALTSVSNAQNLYRQIYEQVHPPPPPPDPTIISGTADQIQKEVQALLSDRLPGNAEIVTQETEIDEGQMTSSSYRGELTISVKLRRGEQLSPAKVPLAKIRSESTFSEPTSSSAYPLDQNQHTYRIGKAEVLNWVN